MRLSSLLDGRQSTTCCKLARRVRGLVAFGGYVALDRLESSRLASSFTLLSVRLGLGLTGGGFGLRRRAVYPLHGSCLRHFAVYQLDTA